VNLSASETRVLGCLLEKQRTTPDVYPLTLNALRLACNQATNRDPVVEYDDPLIRNALHRLERLGLIRLASGRGSRAPKYRHLLAEALPMSPAEQAVMCVLMLRGPQTPGELKQRTERMHSFTDLDAVQQALTGLIERGLLVRLERRPAQKEERYAQLLGRGADAEGELEGPTPAASGEPDGALGPGSSSPAGAPPAPPAADTLARLGERVARLEREVAELRASEQAGRPVEATL
jgi:uncharacterized protein YceH (UPF0502 family)